MAILATHLKMNIRGTILGQQWQAIQWYRIDGAAFLTADPIQVGEAYWNDIKTALRNYMPANGAVMTVDNILVSEPGSAGAYAEYAIPTAETIGLRVVTSAGDPMPPYVSAGIRLTVGTRVTRPGQKRFPGVYEIDNVNGVMQNGLRTLVNALALKFSDQLNLGSPVATGVLYPAIVRLDSAGDIAVAQDVTGFVLNTNLTTQNSRKFGRGS